MPIAPDGLFGYTVNGEYSRSRATIDRKRTDDTDQGIQNQTGNTARLPLEFHVQADSSAPTDRLKVELLQELATAPARDFGNSPPGGYNMPNDDPPEACNLARHMMNAREGGSITGWLGNLKDGDQAAAQPLWEHYFSEAGRRWRARSSGGCARRPPIRTRKTRP